MCGALRRNVKECFILADAGKELTRPRLKDHPAKLREKKAEIQAWTYDRVEDTIKKKGNLERAPRFDTWNWDFEKLLLTELAVYPTMCELPKQYCFGDVPDTAARVRGLLLGDKKPNDLSHEANRRIKKLREMLQMISEASNSEVEEYLKLNPIIVVEGGTIRNKTEGYKILKWDIDDGSSRAVIVTLSARDKMQAYAGTRPH
jgi:hypothetical protein